MTVIPCSMGLGPIGCCLKHQGALFDVDLHRSKIFYTNGSDGKYTLASLGISLLANEG